MFKDNTIPYEDLKKEKAEKITLKLIKKSKLSDSQRETVMQFYNTLRLGKKIFYMRNNIPVKLNPQSYKSFEAYVRIAVMFGEYFKKDYIEATKDDIENFQLYLQNKKNKRTGLKISHETIEHYLIQIRIFYIWMYNGQELPELVEDIQRRKSRVEPLKENEVLSVKEIDKLIRGCMRARDKALISLMFETGARVGEIASCNINDFINFGRYAKVRLRGKTGMRNVAVSDCIVYIEKWLNEHPTNDVDEAPLFISISTNNYKQRLTPRGIASIIERAAEQAGITKSYNPHWFRHSGLDHYTKKYHANERDLKIRAGWCMSSKMHLRYIHYGEDEVNMNYLKAKGIDVGTKDTKYDKILEPKVCTRCKNIYPDDEDKWLHPSTALYCHCGQVLDVHEFERLEKLKAEAKNFNEILTQQPIPTTIDSTTNFNEALYQTMKQNPLLLDKFKEIISKHKLV